MGDGGRDEGGREEEREAQMKTIEWIDEQVRRVDGYKTDREGKLKEYSECILLLEKEIGEFKAEIGRLKVERKVLEELGNTPGVVDGYFQMADLWEEKLERIDKALFNGEEGDDDRIAKIREIMVRR